MEPFTYPDLPHVRRHGPLGYADADSYRPGYLRVSGKRHALLINFGAAKLEIRKLIL